MNYTYMVKAYDRYNNLSDPSNLIVATLIDSQAPTAPRNLIATAVTGSAIELTWSSSTDDVGVEAYDIYSGETYVGSVGAVTIYIVSGLEQGVGYYFTVKARDAAGNISEPSNIASVITIIDKPELLELIYEEVGITIRWTEVSGVDSYELSINGEIINVGNSLAYLQEQLIPNNNYVYRIRSKKGLDTSEWSDKITFLSAPDKVQGVKAKVLDESTIEITWNAMTGDVLYEIEVNGVIIGIVRDTAYVHTDIIDSKVNNYRVRAINEELKGVWSDSVLQAAKTIIGGIITHDTIWDSASGIYIVQSNLTISQGVTLEVLRGTIIKFVANTGLDIRGLLIAQGSAEAPIIFTSYMDSDYGGIGVSTYDDYWSGFKISKTGELKGTNINLRYGGGQRNSYNCIAVSGILNLDKSIVSKSYLDGIAISSGGDIIIQNSIIEDSKGYGINISKNGILTGNVTLRNNVIRNGSSHGLMIYESGDSGFVAENNVIENNAGGIVVYAHNTGLFSIKGNTIKNNLYSSISVGLDYIKTSLLFEGISENIYERNGYSNLVCLTGRVNNDLTICGDKFYTSFITIGSGKTLTINPGVILLSAPDTGGGIIVEGKLIAHGTKDKPIVFTSFKDPAYGGSGVKTSGDYWRGCYILSTGEFVGNYVTVSYGGGCPENSYNGLSVSGILDLNNSIVSNSYIDGIKIYSGKDIVIQNSIVENSKGYNINVSKGGTLTGNVTLRNNIIRNGSSHGLSIYESGDSGFVAENNVIEKNAGGIVVYSHSTGLFSVKGNTIKNNIYFPISVRLDYIKTSILFEGISENILIENGYSDLVSLTGQVNYDLIISGEKFHIGCITIGSGRTLTIQPGVILLSAPNTGGGIIVEGKLIALGTKDEPIVFTSLKDPAYRGSGVLASGDFWRGCYILSTGEFIGNYVTVSYGGGCPENSYNNLTVKGALSLYNSEVSNSYTYGIYFDSNIQPNINFNSFINNKLFGIYNARPNVIKALYNYWNSIYGPSIYTQIYDTSTRIWKWQWIGSGDKVVGVNYNPYLGSEMNISFHFSKVNGTYAPTGNYSNQAIDMKLDCLGENLDFTRYYNSQDNKYGIYGKGWSFKYESSITSFELDDNIKVVKFPNGSTEYYELKSDGTFISINSRSTLINKEDGTYILTTKDQAKYGFNTSGHLTWIENKYGNRLTITLGINGQPIRMMDYVGRHYNFSYNSSNLLESIKDELGRQVNFTYNNERLIKVVDPAGIVTNYSYDDNGYLSEIKNGKNEIIEVISYIKDNEVFKVNQIIDAYGNIKSYSYNEISGKTTITDSNGYSTVQWYDTTYNVTNTIDNEGKSTIISYFTDGGINTFGDIKSITDRNGNLKTFERDSRGNITKINNPDGSYKQLTYDSKNNRISERDENGKYTFYIYDATCTYLLRVVQPLNGSDLYSASNDQSKYSVTSYEYYLKGEDGCTINGLVKSITDPEGYIITYTYDAYGYPKAANDELNNITIYNYNMVGFMTSTLSPTGERTEYTYDSNGKLLTMKTNGGETSRIVYDELGRKRQEVAPNQYSGVLSDDIGYRYTYYNNGTVRTIMDPENNTSSYIYDLYGNILTENKPNGSIYSYEYDSLNRITKEYFQSLGGTEKVLLKSYSYSILADKKTQKAETVFLNETDTATTYYTYDYANRNVKQVNPDGSINSVVYNANGTINSSMDAKGKTTYFKYDGLNRLTEQWIPFGDSKYTYKSIAYDKKGNKIANSVGIEAVALWGVSTKLLTSTYEYDCNNHMLKSIDTAGGIAEFEYNANGNVGKEILHLSETAKRITEYEYNHLGKVVTKLQHTEAGSINGNDVGDITDTLLVTSFTYDANGNVKSMTTPDHITTIYSYDNLNRLTSQAVQGIDEYGENVTKVIHTTYDFAGNILTIKDANGHVTENLYNQRGLLEKTIDPLGGKTAYHYDNVGRLTAKVSPNNYIEGASLSEMSRAVYTYDSMSRIILEQDIYYDEAAGSFRTINSKAYRYDLNGNVIKTLDALGYASGTGTTIAEKISTGYGTSNAYNDANLLLTTQSPVTKDRGLSFDVKYAYDAAGRKISETNANNIVIKYYYDGAGRITRQTLLDTTEKVLQESTYDRMGNVLTQTDGNGNTTTYTYNNLGLLSSMTTPGDESIDTYTVYYQYNNQGQLAYQKDSIGKAILYTYNHEGKVLSQTEQAEDGFQRIIISYAYDKNGNLRYATDGNGATTEYTYDDLNRVHNTIIHVNGIEQITTNGYDGNGNQISTTDWLGNTYTNTYDPLNRLICKADPYGKVIERYEYNDNHAQVKAYDALGNVTEYAYDKNNRLTDTKDPAGNITSQTYDNIGNLATKNDGRSNVTTYEYDKLNRLVSVTNAKGEITSYTYDLNGNKLTQKDGKGNTLTFNYNAANLLLERTEPKNVSGTGNKDSYTYYANRLVKTRTDKKGKVFTYTYDVHGNLLKEAVAEEVITYTYDNNKNMLTMEDATGITNRTYDELGRVLTKTVLGVGTVTYEYDVTAGAEAGCHKETASDPKGNVTKKVYDKAGRLSKVIVGEETTAYTYYDNGNRKSVIYSNGAKEEYIYYANNQVETLINRKPDGSIMDSYTYTYDESGNQLTKHEIINGVEKGTTEYTYDSLNRLYTVTEPNDRTTSYTYDKAGNRETETIVENGITTVNTYTYSNQNRLTEITTKVNNILTQVTSYIYDSNGNQLTTTVKAYSDGAVTSEKETSTNSYDYRNQLIKTVTEDGAIIKNHYNAEGYRVFKESDGKATYYFYEADKVVLEVDSNGNQIARNVYGTNLLMRTVDGETYYYMYNGHADVTALLTGEGEIAATYYYDAFGNILESTGDVDNNILYSGYQYDEETRLYYLNARMYDPKIARFLQEDTYAGDPNDPLSLNLYTYCANNPIVFWDPTGHSALELYEDERIGDKFKRFFDNLNTVSDFILSFEGSFIGETFNNLVYKPTYSIGKGIGKIEDSLFGTNYTNKSIESYKADTDLTVSMFNKWGTNQLAKDIGGLDGSIFGQGLQMAMLWKIGDTAGLGSNLQPMDRHIALNFMSGSTSTLLNGYADGYRGQDLIYKSVETGAVGAVGGAAFDYLSPKLPILWRNFKNVFNKKNSANVLDVNAYSNSYSYNLQKLDDIGDDLIEGELYSRNTKLSFDEALIELDNSGLRPGQTEISKNRVLEIVESYDPIKAQSSVYTDVTGRYLVEGHHTTIANTMLGRGSGVNMNIPTQQMPSVTDIYWAKKWYEFGKKVIRINK